MRGSCSRKPRRFCSTRPGPGWPVHRYYRGPRSVSIGSDIATLERPDLANSRSLFCWWESCPMTMWKAKGLLVAGAGVGLPRLSFPVTSCAAGSLPVRGTSVHQTWAGDHTHAHDSFPSKNLPRHPRSFWVLSCPQAHICTLPASPPTPSVLPSLQRSPKLGFLGLTAGTPRSVGWRGERRGSPTLACCGGCWGWWEDPGRFLIQVGLCEVRESCLEEGTSERSIECSALGR